MDWQGLRIILAYCKGDQNQNKYFLVSEKGIIFKQKLGKKNDKKITGDVSPRVQLNSLHAG